MKDRRSALEFVSRKLGTRDLIWGGLRADDVQGISDLEQVAGSFSIIGGYNCACPLPGLDFEDIFGTRMDLDSWDIEDDLDSPAAQEFRDGLLSRLAGPTALLPYRPSTFLSSVLFTRRDRCLSLGLFGGHQAMFEHKPWVETNVAALGVPCMPWTYVADEEQAAARSMLRDGPLMLRVSRSSGGTGLVRVDDRDRLATSWPHRREAFVSVAPYLERVVPINVGATVWHDGVTISHPSVQIVGIPECTTRPFGYCGNDFGLASELDRSVMDMIESSVSRVGRWLRGYGYLGTFGADFLVHNGVPLFAEINARFQGSTHASSQLSVEAGESCVMLDHIAAMLGRAAPIRRRLADVASDLPPLAHLVVHWTGDSTVLDSAPFIRFLKSQAKTCRVDIAAKPGLVIESGGVIGRVTIRERMTATGFELCEPWRSLLAGWTNAVTPQLGAVVGR